MLRDLLRIYGLVFGVMLIVLPALFLILAAVSGYWAVVTILGCGSLVFFILGALVLWGILAQKRTMQYQYYAVQQHGYAPYYDPYSGQYGYVPQPYYQVYGVPAATGSGLTEKLDLPGVRFLLPVFLIAVGAGAVALYIGGGALVLLPFSVLIAFSFPSLMWISYVHGKDIHEPEPARAVLMVLTWGMLSVVPAFLLELPGLVLGSLVGAALVAPLVEEFVKVAGLPLVRKEINGELDGLIYGVTAGMGFAMIENLFYELPLALSDVVQLPAAVSLWGWNIHIPLWSYTSLVRGLASTVIHAAGAGIIGYTYARYIHGRGTVMHMAMAYIAASLIHGTWNLAASLVSAGGTPSQGAVAGFAVFLIVYPPVVFLILNTFLAKAVARDRSDAEMMRLRAAAEGAAVPKPPAG